MENPKIEILSPKEEYVYQKDMEPPRDVEKYNLFGEALQKIVEYYFSEYIQKLEEYHRGILETQLGAVTGGYYFICEKCGIPDHWDSSMFCGCRVRNNDVCKYCIPLADNVEKVDEKRFRCKGCLTEFEVRRFPRRPVKPVPPFSK